MKKFLKTSKSAIITIGLALAFGIASGVTGTSNNRVTKINGPVDFQSVSGKKAFKTNLQLGPPPEKPKAMATNARIELLDEYGG